MREDRQDRFVEMTEAPIAPLIIRLAIPCIISMLVSSFYNMADTFFVGMLDNNSATGAVGVVFSVMALIQAVGFFFGQGSGTFISRSLGQQDQDSASKMVATGFTFARALGEYGATSMIAGYTPGRTATISTTVYQLWRTNDNMGAASWVLVNRLQKK